MDFELFDAAKADPVAYEKAASTNSVDVSNDGEAKPPSWAEVFQIALMDGTAFREQKVPQRAKLLGEFLREGDLGLLYAARGVGKTWMALLMAKAIAEGAPLGAWNAGNSGKQRVCYLDGEVNLPDAIDRAVLVNLPPSVHWIHHESIYQSTGRSLNLADRSQQEALLQILQEKNIRILFLDNISCLMRGVAENEADAWEAVLDWLLELRRAGLTVILIHHAGRSGQMRGTSRREDAAHWVLKLENESDGESSGASFKSRFEKNRNARQGNVSCPPLNWSLNTKDTVLQVECDRHSDVDALVGLVRDGMTSAKQIADELGVTAGTVSKWARKAEDEGRIRIQGRKYLPP